MLAGLIWRACAGDLVLARAVLLCSLAAGAAPVNSSAGSSSPIGKRLHLHGCSLISSLDEKGCGKIVFVSVHVSIVMKKSLSRKRNRVETS